MTVLVLANGRWCLEALHMHSYGACVQTFHCYQLLWIDYDDNKKLIFYVVEEVSLYVNKWPGSAKPNPACNSRWANEPWLMLMTKPTQGFRVHQCSSAEFTTPRHDGHYHR